MPLRVLRCASVDLTLGNEFRFFKPGHDRVIHVDETTDYRQHTELITLKDDEEYLLLPGQACLGITRERIRLNSNICGLLEGRSRFARLGLFVHITAGFMNVRRGRWLGGGAGGRSARGVTSCGLTRASEQPGIDNQQVLEIYNASIVRLA